jgi:hypothetical protein
MEALVRALISVRSKVNPRAMVRLEGLGKLKKKISDRFGTRTRDHPACSIEPQPSTLPFAPQEINIYALLYFLKAFTYCLGKVVCFSLLDRKYGLSSGSGLPAVGGCFNLFFCFLYLTSLAIKLFVLDAVTVEKES